MFSSANKLHMNSGKQQLADNGYLILDAVYSQDEVNRIAGMIDALIGHERGSTHAIRAVLQQVPVLKDVLLNERMQQLISQYLGDDFFLVKSIYFNKPASSNWFVSYHQDLSVHAAHRADHTGFVNWTKKEGHIGVQPPATILEAIYTIRIHLDDCDTGNGALRVIKGSHRQGIARFDMTTSLHKEISCPVPKGGVMIMRPLLFHASGKNTSSGNRSVLHLEFCNKELPAAIGWAEKELIFAVSE